MLSHPPPFGPGRYLQRLILRRAAQRYAARNWPVVPGATLTDGRFDCGEPGCPTIAQHPALTDWESEATNDTGRITDWWRLQDHGVLLATGRSFDVLELAGRAGRQVSRAVHGPIAVAPRLRWMFLVRAGGTLLGELAEHSAVVLHRSGSWIPAPPTPLPEGRVRWVRTPESCDWRLPGAEEVQRAALAALAYDRQPRQLWWPQNRTA
ncbi:DNA primase [Virgisporangium aliadipatigenens]|uniref:DNA primase n=1 Tax=Virgisporangium aliadipatigenens TaxID=741659 RepID=A0A8J4DS83_9ACTN|nr:bifunctional DNA primase/polymerase [Virgisporangium aliadipatigenens]GIJ47007.1 DNA primase [Virgisporangium aliadipatigenens]